MKQLTLVLKSGRTVLRTSSINVPAEAVETCLCKKPVTLAKAIKRLEWILSGYHHHTVVAEARLLSNLRDKTCKVLFK